MGKSVRTFIGIDPAFREYGIGICVLIEGQNGLKATFPRYRTTWDALNAIADIARHAEGMDDTFFAVENSNQQNTTFQKYYGGKNVGQLLKISRNVGANQAISQLIVDLLKGYDVELLEISPERKGSKWTKEGAAMIAKQYGIELPKTSQDDRDALKLALILFEKKSGEKRPLLTI